MSSAAALLVVAADGGDGLATNEGGEEQTPPDKVMEAEKPWACCSSTVCKESLPPVCRCLDKVKECAAACKLCEPSGVSHVVCNDWYRGDPGPMCA